MQKEDAGGFRKGTATWRLNNPRNAAQGQDENCVESKAGAAIVEGGELREGRAAEALPPFEERDALLVAAEGVGDVLLGEAAREPFHAERRRDHWGHLLVWSASAYVRMARVSRRER